MRQELVRGGTAADVDAEADTEERFELLAEFLGLLQTRSAVGGNEVQCLQRLLVQIWRLGFNHFNSHDPQRPAVDLRAVFLLLDDLRGHPVRRADHCGSLILRLGKFGTESKISCGIVSITCGQCSARRLLTNLDMPSTIKKNIITLDITVNNALTVQMRQSFAGLLNE